MSKISEQSKLLQTKILLEHYHVICSLSELSEEEFSVLIYNTNPTIYAAFKNRQITAEEVHHIVSDYKRITEKTIKKIKNFFNSEEYKKYTEKYYPIYISYMIIRLKHINKKNISNELIKNKLHIQQKNFCREYQKALKLFQRYFIEVAKKSGYKNVFENIRIIELIRLDKETKKKQTTKNIA